jgi:hypothetical protein
VLAESVRSDVGSYAITQGALAASANYALTGAIGPDLFRAACDMGLEGLVSKRSDRPYRGGRSPHWIKVKNRTHPAMARVMESMR